MQELDRVLDRHHVRGARPVDVVDHRGERRALAAAGRAGDQHQAALFPGDPLEHRREAELLDRADLHRNHAQHQPDRAALLEDVAAETAEPGDAVGEVDFLRFLELLALGRRHHRGAHRHDILVVEPLLFGGRGELRRGRASSGKLPTLMWRSDAPLSTAIFRRSLTCMVFGPGLGIGGRGLASPSP